MKCAVISFTRNGGKLNQILCRKLSEAGYPSIGCSIPKYAQPPELPSLQEPLKDWTGRMFREADALIFIGACGIAVRSIAPFVQDKKTDPAVLVIDEQGKFVISLLSGHLGGASGKICRGRVRERERAGDPGDGSGKGSVRTDCGRTEGRNLFRVSDGR